MHLRPLALACLLALVAAVAPAAAHDGAHPTHRDTIQEVNFDFVGAIEGNESAIASGYGDAGLSYLPLRWCGTPRTTDDTANQVHGASLPQIRFIYARASDQEDRTLAWADLLQANASLVSRFYAQQSDGQRAPRIDLGNECGPQYIDLTTVNLPNPRSAYVDSFATVEAAVDAALPRTGSRPRIYVILADKLSSKSAGYLWGQGSYWHDDAKGTGNWNNRGGVTTVIWIPQAQTLPTTSSAKDQGFWPEGFLHELTHNFGGVQNTSPNSTQAGHCRDGRDVMCYSDGGLSYSSGVCPAISSFTTGFVQTLDCNRDDYFSPAPAPTSWLGTHFNTFDNVFNGDCPALGDQCGGGVAPAVSGGPAITGFARDGQTVVGDLGTWSGEPALSWQWEEEVSGTWQPFAHAALSLPLGSSHVGRRFRLKVTATGAETVVARSQPVVVSAKVPPSNVVRPSISGTARNGETLTANPGEWTEAASFAYQWFWVDAGTDASEAIPGATGTSYALTEEDVGHSIGLRVVATSVDGLTTASTSALAGPVVTAPINVGLPSVSGIAKVGQTLDSTLGSWSSPSSVTYAREWQRETGSTWESIAGATSSTYVLTAADAGLRVRLLVRATNTNGTTTATSAATTAVAPLAPPANTGEPVAAGVAQQGQTLTAQGDTWTGATSTSVKWERRAPGGSWSAISGATARSHVLVAADVDSEVRAVVTAVNGDGSTTVPSAARGPVLTNVPPENTVPPAVNGIARTAETLTATPGTWLRTDSFTYVWQRLAGGVWSDVGSGATYVPVEADGGFPLRVLVTATGPGGSASAASAQTATVADPPVLLAAPSVTGTPKRGRTLTASAGEWEKATSFDYVWERRTGDDWSAIADATAASYVPAAGDVGHALRVRVTASNSTGAAAPVASAATEPIADAPAPVLVAEPVVNGTPYAGETLTAAGDDWTGATSIAIRWQRRAAGGDWSDIAGATARTYTLTAADVEGDVRVLLTASNEDGETLAASPARGPVDGDPVNEAAPSISGAARTGATLTASPGTWRRASSFAFAWERFSGGEWTPIAGAAGSTYVPGDADAGLPLRVVVTGTGSRASTAAASAPTAAVAYPPILSAAPSVSGTARRGQTLTASPGTWNGATSFAYAWQRRTGDVWAAIDGATASTYVPGAADTGHALRVRVIATNATGDTSAWSEPTAAVADLQPPATVVPPLVSGTLYVGEVLTAGGDAWGAGTTTTVAWQRKIGDGAWTPVGTGRSYTLVPDDTGALIRAVVTAQNGDGTTVVESDVRGPVDADPLNTVPPAVSGTPRVAQPLTASAGTWLRASSLAYRWQRLAEGGWTDIPGAAQATYVPVAADAGLPLRVVVTGVGNRTSVAAASAQTAAVAAVAVEEPAPGPEPQPEPQPAVEQPAPEQTLTAEPPAQPARFTVPLRTGRRSAGRLTIVVRGATATVTGAKLKLRGAYTARFCAGRKCVTRKVKVAGGRLKITGVALPARSGAIAVTLKPRRGKAATGRLQLAG